MQVSKEDRERYMRDAEKYESLKNQLGRQSIDNFIFIKSQLGDWYIALTAVCFAIGGIAISIGTDKAFKNSIFHPSLFWWGSLLLIANGTLVFLVRKIELEKESSDMPNLKKTEADLWTARNIARELADGIDSRLNDFKAIQKRILNDYHDRIAPLKWWQWVGFIVHACFIDIVFGLLLFPVLMLSSQLLTEIHVSFSVYTWAFWIAFALYISYTIFQGSKIVTEKKETQATDEQIKSEVER